MLQFYSNSSLPLANKYLKDSKVKQNALLRVILINILFLISNSINFKELTVVSDNYIIGQLATYEITYDRTQQNYGVSIDVNSYPVEAGSTLTLKFPSQYVIDNSIKINAQVNNGAIVSPSFSISGSLITISSLFGSQMIVSTIVLTISNVKNPIPAITTSPFTGTIGSDVSVSIYQYSLVQLSPANFKKCYMTFNPRYVNRTGSMIFNLTAKTNLPIDSTIDIQFNSNIWTRQISTTNYLPITSTSMPCGNLSQNIKSTINCLGVSNKNKITISNMFSSIINSGDYFIFEIKNFLSPPTNQPVDLIKITSYTIYNGSPAKINICSDYITDLIPNVLSSSTISITTSAGTGLTVNRVYTLRFAFQTVDTFHINDYFEIQFPNGSNFNYNSNTLSGGLSLSRTNSFFSNNILRLYMNTSISIKTYGSPYTMYVIVGQYSTPPSIQTTSNWKFSILRNGLPMQVGFQTLTPLSTTLTGSITSRLSDIVNRNTSYTFSVTIADSLSSTGKIRIRFPLQISILTTSSNCGSISGTNLSSTPVCIINSASKTIDFTNINSTNNLINAQTFSITIDGIKNPSSTINSGVFQIRTYYKNEDTSLVAIGSIPGLVSKQANIDPANVIITSTSYKVLQNSVTYSIKYKNQNEIPIDGSIQLFVPKPIIVNTNSLSSSCKRGINSDTTQNTQCGLALQDSSGYLINFTKPFSTQGLLVNSSVILQLSLLITNGPSTAPISSFKIYTYSSNTNLISKIQSSLSISMTDPTSLSSATYSKLSLKNYDITTYDFTIKQLASMQRSSQVLIQFPNQIIPNTNSTCSLKAPIVENNLLCLLVNSSVIKVILSNSTIDSNTGITISITNIRNAVSYRPSGDFIIRTFTSLSNYKYGVGITSNKVSNSIPSSFLSVTGLYSPSQLDSNISLSVSFQSSYQAPSYLQISIPSYFIVGTLACSQVTNFNGICSSLSSHTLNISGTFPLKGITTFQIHGFKSKSTLAPTNYIILNSFTSDGYQLDQSNDRVSFSLECIMPCRSCDSTNKSYCKSCYENVSITDKILYDSVTNNCYNDCPNGYYQNYQLYECSKCDSNCLTCQGTSSYCMSCVSTSTYKYLQIASNTSQYCVNNCKIGYYPDLTRTPFTCTFCINNCKTCTTANLCLTCNTNYFIWNSACTDSCPVGNTVPDSSTGNCQLCSTNCKTCSIKTNNCTSCTSPLFLYNYQCVSQCKAPTVYRPQMNTCGACDKQCKTCQKSASNCTSCDSTSIYLYYFNFDCLTECPNLYYEGNGVCLLCSALSINCDYCVNSTYCQTCNQEYVFLNGSCLSTVPPGYVNISGQALPCTGDCATCIVTQSNCTSCKTMNLNSNVCQLNCPSGTISINKKCTSCQYPCRTCAQNINNCTTCLANQTPQLYLIQNRCQLTCPLYYYADNTTNRCNQCQSPCQKCTDLTACSSCVNKYFLYGNTSCISNCPLKYVGINKICQACISPCKTCVDSTTKCISCQLTYFYLNSTNKCLQDCGQGLFKQYINQTCIACTQPCKTCVNTTDTCLSCLTGILYNNICLSKCPQKMYNSSNVCYACPSQCKACTSTVNCTSCASEYLLYNNFCINKCPQTYAVVINGQCTKCSDQFCHKCYDNDLCFNCISGYSLLNGACLSFCPSGYKTNGTHCLDVVQSALTSGSLFPVPFTISTAVVLIAVLMSKLQFDKTFLSGAIFALVGIIQTLSLLYYIYLYYIQYYMQYPIGLYVALGSLGILYLLNILSIFQSIILCYDKKFTQWRDSSLLNKIFNSFNIFVSILISHKFKNIIFSRLFAFHIFSAMVDDLKRFKIFNIFSFISLIHSGSAIFSVITIIKIADNKTQFFHACLDLLIVTSINIVFAFFNAMKGKDFFDQMTPQGFLLNKKVFADQQSINGKISIDGNDIQKEQGIGYYSKIQHTLASNNAFKFNKQSDESRQDLRSEDSLTNVKQQKQYEQISVQAYDILDEKVPQNRIDYSTMKYNDNVNISKFTNVFQNQNQDRSIQNTIQYNRKVNQSVQKYDDISKVDVSLQRTKIQDDKYDQSIQYSNHQYNNKKDQSMNMTNDYRYNQNVSIQNDSIDLVDRSNQYTIFMSEKGVQQLVSLNDVSVQQRPDMISQAQQNTIIQHNNVSIQKQQPNIQYNQLQDQLIEDIQISKSNNIIFIDEQQQQENSLNKQKATLQRQMLNQPETDQLGIPIQEIINHQEQLYLKLKKKKQQLQNMRQQIKQKQKQNQLKQKLLKQQQQNQQQQQQFQSQYVNNNNFVIDMNKYIKQKQLSSIQNNNDSDAHQSIKTKAKKYYTNNNRNEIKQQINKGALNQQNQLPFQSPSKRQKIPGQIICFMDDTGKQKSNLNLLPSNDQNQQNQQNYIYQVSNNDLNLDEDEIESFGHNISRAQTNKNNIYNKKYNQIKKQQNGFQSSATQVLPYKRKNQQYQNNQIKNKIELIKNNNQFFSQKQNDDLENNNYFKNNNQQNKDMNKLIMLKQQNIDINSSQQIPQNAFINKNKQVYSQVQDNHYQSNMKIKQQSKINQYDQIRKSFNNLIRQQSNSNHKKIPQDNDKQSRVNLTNNYQTNKRQNNKNNKNQLKNQKSSSLLATAAMNNLLVDNQNTALNKKNSSKRNPLITKKKWEHENQYKNNDLSSEQGDDSFIGQFTTKVKVNTERKKQDKPFKMDLVVPFQTDKEQTSFTISGIKAIESARNQKSFKKIQDKSNSILKMTPRDILSHQNYAQQVQVHFDRQQKNHDSNINPPRIHQISTVRERSKQRPPRSSIQKNYNNQPSKPAFLNQKKFESQQIFGESQQQSIDNKNSTYREHRNNILMDKINDRPQNDDLLQYYQKSVVRNNNRSKSKNNQYSRNSKSKSGVSPKKQESERNLQKIYMQRLDPKTGSNSKKY